MSLESSNTDGISTNISLKYYQVANEDSITLQIAEAEPTKFNGERKAALFLTIFAARPTNPDVAVNLHLSD